MNGTKNVKVLLPVLFCMLAVSFAFANGAKEKEPAKTSSAVPSATTTTVVAAKPAKAAVVAELPRNQTLYFNGQQWGAVNDQNPLSTSSNCWYQAQNTLSRELVWETLYMFNPLDGKLYPLLADGDYVQKGKVFTIKIKNPIVQ